MSGTTEPPRATLEPLTLDQKFALLADRQRRTLLLVLGSVGDPVSIDGLAERFLAREDPASATDSAALEELELKLHHVHVPKLARHDILEYDAESGIVSRGPRFDRIYSWLESHDER
ncbi:DUF7344 domain-containing protein [Halopelagius longus]|uniref:DUF7344 domain-containing protein n=1 Tax=Halopelagius longus TaxID=1236180 RepID=A0A1H1BL24_9EURY|nr:hypothetical protein [Halopelagius longus]RDI70826.1 hypothetical protein DWB78_03275 [Halopelagius longus]SDQ52579.1 hypothetical protein SAMN05216278_1843 [Halopelagius longus]